MPLDQTTLSALTTAATEAASNAYAPYSKFQVGAALLFEDGIIVSGCNVENASYGLACCAERNALFRSVCERGACHKICAAAIFHDGLEACLPCGACLQVLSEFVASGACAIYYSQGSHFSVASLDEMMPMRFGPRSLNVHT